MRDRKNRLFGVQRLAPYLKAYRVPLFVMIVTSGAGSAVDIGVPLFQRYALNHFVTEATLDTLPLFLILYTLIILFSAVLNYISGIYGMKIEVGVDMDLRNAAFSHLQTLSFSYYNQNSVGYIHARVMSDTSRIGELCSWTLLNAVWQGCYLIGALLVMIITNVKLAMPVIAILPAAAFLFSMFEKKLTQVNRQIREVNSQITGNFNEGISGARTIKSLVIEDRMKRDFVDTTEMMRRKNVRASRLRGAFSSTMNFASSLALALVLWKGGYIAAAQIGTFSMFMSYAQGMMEPVRWIVDAVGGLVTTQVNIERLSTLLETKADVEDSEAVRSRYGDSFNPKKENWEPMIGDVEFDDVSFRYPDGEETILEHFSLKIPFGTNLAIVGETGAGKSTLANLICRFYDPTGGRVLMDGRDLRERSQLWLHSGIGYVQQTPHLFSGTVRENLLYGNPDADDEQIDRALRMVAAKDMVDDLKNGLDTEVGEGGDLLSTGEKQLLCFARAILADPKILILDEATASVDTITEKKIQDAIEAITSGRTAIVIAHRLSTVRNADWILRVENGRIVEQGTHRQLMAARGGYWRLYTRQYEDEVTLGVLG